MDQKTHWKKLTNPDYLGAYALDPGTDIVLTIRSLEMKSVKGPDGKEAECLVANFVEEVKPMVLNATNCKTISNLYNSSFIEDWVGKQIQLFSTEVKAFGDVVDALRIRPTIPKSSKPVLDKNYKGWNAAILALQNSETSIEFILSKYIVSDDVLKILEKEFNSSKKDKAGAE